MSTEAQPKPTFGATRTKPRTQSKQKKRFSTTHFELCAA
jgi:hypothetical protein